MREEGGGLNYTLERQEQDKIKIKNLVSIKIKQIIGKNKADRKKNESMSKYYALH